MKIKSHFKEYSVDFIDSLQSLSTFANEKESFFVIDKKVFDLYKSQLPNIPKNQLYLLEVKEEIKNIETVLCICEKMTSMPTKRNTHLISIGGGIIQDLTGFVANSLYRGIRWTFYPSTLLAACDSCIGGKSSLNYKGFKNLLGSFYPPDVIYIWEDFFSTLSLKDYCSGLGEVVKFNVIAGKENLNKIENDIQSILNHDYLLLEKYVHSSLEFKKKFIEEDEFDKGVRVLLNFAHTFGHAYEVTSRYEIPHGSAVALGMISANHISVKRGFIDLSYAQRIEAVCKKILTEIKVKDEFFDLSKILDAIHKDKKQTSENISAVLIKADYSLGVFKDVKTEEIREAMEYVASFMRE